MKNTYKSKALLQENMLEWELKAFGGVDYKSDSSQIAENRSPNMVNLVLDNSGALAKRCGFKNLIPKASPGGPVSFIKPMASTGQWIYSAGDNLYRWRPPMPCGELIGKTAGPVKSAFIMGHKIWLLDGSNYWSYNGENLKLVREEAYIPLVYRYLPPLPQNSPKYEEVNLLSKYYRVRFSTTDTDLNYIIPNIGNAAVCAGVKLGGEALSPSQYSFNSSPMILSFSAPLGTGEDNLEVTLEISSKSHELWKSYIEKASYCGVFGGENDTRVFLTGNPDYPNYDWYCALSDPGYFPFNQYTAVGWGDDPILAYSIQYDSMIIHKKKTTWSRRFEIMENKAVFPVRPVNDGIGIISPNSRQLIENSPAVLTDTGVYRLSGGLVRDERNMEHISSLVDSRLLKEDLKKAISFDYNGWYGLGLEDRVYIYDYRHKEWLFWEGIPAACFCVHEGRLYFGSSLEGQICVFKQKGEEDFLTDNGRGYKACWQSKSWDLGSSGLYKLIKGLIITLNGQGEKNGASLSFISDRSPWQALKGCFWGLPSFNLWDFNSLSFIINWLPQVFIRRLQAKRVMYCSVRAENDNPGEGMEISKLAFVYQLEKPKRN